MLLVSPFNSGLPFLYSLLHPTFHFSKFLFPFYFSFLSMYTSLYFGEIIPFPNGSAVFVIIMNCSVPFSDTNSTSIQRMVRCNINNISFKTNSVCLSLLFFLLSFSCADIIKRPVMHMFPSERAWQNAKATVCCHLFSIATRLPSVATLVAGPCFVDTSLL